MEKMMRFRGATIVSWDSTQGHGFCQVGEARYFVPSWALVPPPRKGQDLSGASLRDVHVDPDYPGGLETVVCATRVGESLPMILDVSEVILNNGGKKTLPQPSEKRVVLAGALKRVPAGTPVAITHYQEQGPVILAYGHTLLNRLVVKAWRPHGKSTRWGVRLMGGLVYYTLPDIEKRAIEAQTMIGLKKGQLRYILIQRECERQVREAVLWQAFVDIVRDELSLHVIFDRAPEDVYDDDLPTEWQWWNYHITPRCDGCAEWGFADLSTAEIITEILRRHIIPMVNYARMIKRGEYGEQKPLTFWKLLRRQHRAAVCAQIGPAICVHSVLEYLLTTESVFPQPDDGLEELGTLEEVARALRWARWSPAARYLIGRLADLARQYEGRVTLPSVRELARVRLLHRRDPRVKDFVDLVALEERYPSWVTVPGVGNVWVTYERVLGVTLARVRLTSEEVLQAWEPVEGLPEGVTLVIVSEHGTGDLETVRQATRQVLMQEMFERAVAELPERGAFWVDEGDNLFPVDPEPEQVAMFQATPIMAIPARFEVTEAGIDAVGWVWEQDLEAVEAALASLEQANEAWRQKRAATAQ